MAAIDKLRVKSYYTFDSLIKWIIIHYPKMLSDVYDWKLTGDDWNKWKENIYNNKIDYLEKMKTFIGVDTFEYDIIDFENAVNKLLTAHYKTNYFPSREECVETLSDLVELNTKLKNKVEYINDIELPITNFRAKYDRILKWRCPIPEVREYLFNQCGVNRKYEWFYRFFFKENY